MSERVRLLEILHSVREYLDAAFQIAEDGTVSVTDTVLPEIERALDKLEEAQKIAESYDYRDSEEQHAKEDEEILWDMGEPPE